MQWTVRTSLPHTVRVQSLQHVIVPLVKCCVLTTLPWEVVTTHCHNLSCWVWRCCSDKIDQVHPPQLRHEGLIGIWNFLICHSLINSECITGRLCLSSVLQLWWLMLVAHVHAHGMLLCVCWRYKNMAELFHCSESARPPNTLSMLEPGRGPM